MIAHFAACTFLQARAEKKHLNVRLNVDEALPSILVGDEVRIRKVLSQLFSNSIKFTQEGSVTFDAQGEWNDDGTFCLAFAVADIGIGIREEELVNLYDSFAKLEEDGYRTVQGTGLGLNFAKRSVEQMHGAIRVQNVYEAGTIFTVRIPQEIKYDLIFMDHMMPEPDGISTLHRLRAEEGNPNRDTPVVALTANAVAGSREEYLRAGFDEYLSKPIIVEKMEQMLQKYLPREKVYFEKEQILETAAEAGWEKILKDMPGPEGELAGKEETEEQVKDISAVSRTGQSESLPVGERTILVVDDDRLNLMVAQKLLAEDYTGE